jgi:hypothetical protein
MLRLLFNLEDDGDMFSETSDDLQRTTLRYILEVTTLHNIKSVVSQATRRREFSISVQMPHPSHLLDLITAIFGAG